MAEEPEDFKKLAEGSFEDFFLVRNADFQPPWRLSEQYIL